MVVAVAEVKQRRLAELLAEDTMATLKSYLRGMRLEVKRAVMEVCIYMTEKERAAVEEELPQARMMLDPLHVIQDANRRVNEDRRLKQQMSRWEIKKSPSFWARRSFQTKTASIWREPLSSFPASRSFGGPRSSSAPFTEPRIELRASDYESSWLWSASKSPLARSISSSNFLPSRSQLAISLDKLNFSLPIIARIV